jgi:hypothetical protein
LAGPDVSSAELVRGSDRLDAAKWSSPGPTARRLGELIDMQHQVARAIEALGFLGFAGT